MSTPETEGITRPPVGRKLCLVCKIRVAIIRNTLPSVAGGRPRLLELSDIELSGQTTLNRQRYILITSASTHSLIQVVLALSFFFSVLCQTLTLTGNPYESDEEDNTFYPDQSSSSDDEQEDSQ